MSLNIRPLHDRLIVKRLDEQEKTAGGIIIPDTAKEKPTKGKVIAVGKGARNETTGQVIPLEVKKGDVVVFAKWGGTEIKIEGEEYLILKEADIMGVEEAA